MGKYRHIKGMRMHTSIYVISIYDEASAKFIHGYYASSRFYTQSIVIHRRWLSLSCDFVDITIESVSDTDLQALCGLHRSTFTTIFNKYCGGDTIIRDHAYLMRIFAYMKLYPLSRSSKPFCDSHIGSIKPGIVYLSSVIDELKSVWNERYVI
jgi:hypothetical protein